VTRHFTIGKEPLRPAEGHTSQSAALTTTAIRGTAIFRFYSNYVGRWSPLNRSSIGRSIAGTAGFNIAVYAAAAIGGVIISRAIGPTTRGEYAAVTSWLGIAIMLGEIGLPTALCFYVARDRQQAPAYFATSHCIMAVTSIAVMIAGMILAPVLAVGHPGLTTGYRLAFACVLIPCFSDNFTSALMGYDQSSWNRVRLCQPLTSFLVIVTLWRINLLNLDSALVVLFASVLVQLCLAYWTCRRIGLGSARYSSRLVRPLVSYGVAQIAAAAPASLNTYLDQLVLSVTVPPADLGRYSIAVSLTLLPGPVVSAIGYVLLPRLAAGKDTSGRTHQLQTNAIWASVLLSVAILAPIDLAAPWLVPLAFGAAYRGVVPLLWILSPGGVFLSSGQVVANLLRGRKRQIVVAKAEGIALIFTLALLGALLPILGVTGAAIASTIPYGVSLAFMLKSLWQIPIENDEGACA
jgi:O-antigen/teichoic acid export membrane protein